MQLPRYLSFSSVQRRRWLLTALGAVIILLGLLLLWRSQTLQRQGESWRQDAVVVADAVADEINSYRRRLRAAPLQRAVSQGEAATLAVLQRHLPESRHVVLLPRRLETFEPDRMDQGYSIMALAIQAEIEVRPTIRFSWQKRAQYGNLLTLVPVSGVADTGFVAVYVDDGPLLEIVNSSRQRAPYLALQQPAGEDEFLTIAGRGYAPQTVGVARRIKVADSNFRIVFPPSPSLGRLYSGNTPLLVILLGLFVLAGAAVARSREFKPVPRSRAAQEILSAGAANVDNSGSSQTTDTDSDVAPSAKAESQPSSASRIPARPAPEPVALSPGIFRAYDIRGVVGKTLDPGVAHQIGQAVGSVALERNASPVAVGRDGRLSGPDLADALMAGIQASGCDVVDVGPVPTPVLYFAAHDSGSGSGVAVTGSHNPPDYNGFKIMVGGETLYGDTIADLYRRISEDDLLKGEGTRESRHVLDDYRQRVASEIQLERPLKVVADCGNGIAGICAPDVLRACGAEVFGLFDEVDGTFPNHHPDPSVPENLTELISAVQLMKADLGVAFDGDGDRLGVVTPAGEVIFPDRLMILLVRELLARQPGATVIYDVKCTGHLADAISAAGGNPLMWKTGHSLIKAKMKEEKAPLAGEMSGHFFFGEPWYGFDDAIYGCAKLLQILAADERTPAEVLEALPDSVSTPELKVEMEEGETFRFIDEFAAQAEFEGARVATIDGVRADWPDGWGLVRSSNTTPVLVLRFDADSEQALERIKDTFRRQMLALNPDLDLPF